MANKATAAVAISGTYGESGAQQPTPFPVYRFG
jgi:hypothetical protein